MKVCTDSCILGAWTATRLKGSQRVLDIGAGTGLLTLMLAQQNPLAIDAIELDADAFEQATENIAASPWPARIHLKQGDARNYDFNHTYDFIITNPPFFEAGLLSPSPAKNKARHAETLTLEELLSIILRNLKKSGSFSILLPSHRTDYFENLAREKGFFLQEKCLVKQTPAHTPFRSVLLFAFKQAAPTNIQQLTIRNEKGNETTELQHLLKDYYLH